MTARQRIDLLARAFPRLFPRAELLRLMRAELGDVDALDKWIRRDGVHVRARAPELIYHVCAGNLAVSACTSLVHGLLIGSRNILKLPGERDDSSARSEILEFVRRLPAPLRHRVEIHRELDPVAFARAEAIIAFGSDATMESLRAKARWDQKFIAHGHALSLLWLDDADALMARQARACAVDILTYDQLGCLSPQAIYLRRCSDWEKLGQKLSSALEREWRKIERKPARPLSVAARITEARDLAAALGHRVWLPPRGHLGWTIIHDPDPTFRPSPLHGVIYLRHAAETKLRAALAPVADRLSTVGWVGKTIAGTSSSRWHDLFLSLGVSRFCEAGHMQFPLLTWHHDGRHVLADLVSWVDSELPH